MDWQCNCARFSTVLSRKSDVKVCKNVLLVACATIVKPGLLELLGVAVGFPHFCHVHRLQADDDLFHIMLR